MSKGGRSFVREHFENGGYWVRATGDKKKRWSFGERFKKRGGSCVNVNFTVPVTVPLVTYFRECLPLEHNTLNHSYM